ncbi:sporulation integral membrane protein YtvI [Acetivibrio thermocellus AD2]|jgi:sporulation integral membrane protein YtvI|uniref:Sporulation integral membrane protein YtvI n=1 Tax=Acetivibrio thermocellus AD2 TaxID=1138384 RepID=A0AB36TFV8_ACETH|nr:sporulation integral membrane protein YtvI [Acetivibrio thermocellus]ADU74266.1 sporulation integral membrane protein YtvI [Acetivibrio thermocellus DSM 1313]ALX08208.1 sporulation integral membrane protein YtvI [Acetivibrio thermocellus AD2]ANV75956.1 sporulation integral membrane protein YtvI [Acetivibrio thermocellus DSM 2360]EIC05960.1 sporulation integral membrane protein YtvI [Acetivibrio thermocellus YS]PFH02481.1 sporulation integral membrane protein YtvI [Acetivibrio thermocellus A
MDKRIKLVIRLVLIFGGTVIGILLGLRLAIYFAPFLIAFAISSMIEPVVRFLMKKLKFRRKFAALVSLLLGLSMIAILLLMLFSKLYNEITSLSSSQPEFWKEAYQNISNLINRGLNIYFGLPSEVTAQISNMVSSLSNSVSSLVDSFVKGIYNTAISIPQMVIFIFVTILSTYFISSDRDRIYDYIKDNVPDALLNKIIDIKDSMFTALFGYVKAQLILMTITFCELSLGFTIIGVKRPILLGLVISFIDAFPVLGTGGVLVPWAIYEFLTKDIRMGVSLLILYVIVLVIRQMIEPKVVGEQIGLHPLMTLITMYLGMKFFGLPGLILGPIVTLIFKNIISGMIKHKNLKELINEFIKK